VSKRGLAPGLRSVGRLVDSRAAWAHRATAIGYRIGRMLESRKNDAHRLAERGPTGAGEAVMDVPADIGSADPGGELREAATTVRERYRSGSPAYGFWRVTAGIWERWAERVELGVKLSPVSQAEFQAALFSARKYLDLRHSDAARVSIGGALSCRGCGQVLASPDEQALPATELSHRLLGHICMSGSSEPPAGRGAGIR